MSLVKKIIEIVDRTDNTDARKNIVKLVRDIKLYKEKVKKLVWNLSKKHLKITTRLTLDWLKNFA